MGVVQERHQHPTVKAASARGDVPALRCDYCGDEINRGADGRAVWEEDERKAYQEVSFVHTGCREGFEEKEDVDMGGMELTPFLRGLAHNLKIDGVRAPSDSGAGAASEAP